MSDCCPVIIQENTTENIIESIEDCNIIQESESNTIVDTTSTDTLVDTSTGVVINIITEGIQGPPGPALSSLPSVIEFQSQESVLGNLQVTIFDYTNASGNSIYINELTAEGNARSELFIYINDVLKIKKRISVADLNAVIPMFDLELATTDNMKIKVIHYELLSADYSSSINYHV